MMKRSEEACKVEQLMEMEALDCLFVHDSEFKQINEQCLILKIQPHPEENEPNHVGLHLNIEFTSFYPDELPLFKIESVWGLDSKDVKSLESIIDICANNERGQPMVYTIAETIQSWLRERNFPPLSMHDQMLQRTTESVEVDEQTTNSTAALSPPKTDNSIQLKQLEERITEREFFKWAENFKKEMQDQGIWKRPNTIDSVGPSGKQLFISSYASDVNFSIDDENIEDDAVSDASDHSSPRCSNESVSYQNQNLMYEAGELATVKNESVSSNVSDVNLCTTKTS